MTTNNNTLLLVAAAAAAIFIMSKKAKAATPSATPLPTSTNVNNQLWTNVLGGAWKSLVSPDSAGSSAFVMRNDLGQVVSSNGKPIDSVYSDISGAISTSGVPGLDVSAPDGTDWLSTMAW